MKFANLRFKSKSINNIGDNMQLMAIDYIYETMGVPQSEIVYIDKDKLDDYEGDYVVLPISMPLSDYSNEGMASRFSRYIIPVFLGLTLAKNTLSSREIDYYRNYQPIGCRDQKTLDLLRSYNLLAYLHGCITATLPLREPSDAQYNCVYLVDPEISVLDFMPRDLLDSSTTLSHSHRGDICPRSLMQEYYNKYKNSASLVVTSLLHCAVPCMAAGIPVILARKSISYRFGWLERLMPIYEPKSFANIDWYPSPILYEDHKQRLLQVSINRINEAFSKHNDAYNLSRFYEERPRKEYVNDAFEPIKASIDRVFSQSGVTLNYAIWGLTQISEIVFDYITQHYPTANLKSVYDSYKSFSFCGLTTLSPDLISLDRNEIIIGTSFGGYEYMANFLLSRGFTDENSIVWSPPNLSTPMSVSKH
jgi:hypothetical protein